ncbi:putative HTH-type transcriptional regulator YyaN [Ktedonobacteria bacterium brp13]|nr:putative HTH-type transcriptional regulator YyaN [Ktedonobacteria bacterium brp13]
MTIQEVAVKTGISAYTIRFYEKSGVLPHIQRAENGARQFSEADVNFLLFLIELKKTGMSLEEIAEFTEDGCILEWLQRGDFPRPSVEKRITILRQHEQRLDEQRRHLDYLFDVVAQKIQFYEQCLEDRQRNNTEIL